VCEEVKKMAKRMVAREDEFVEAINTRIEQLVRAIDSFETKLRILQLEPPPAEHEGAQHQKSKLCAQMEYHLQRLRDTLTGDCLQAQVDLDPERRFEHAMKQRMAGHMSLLDVLLSDIFSSTNDHVQEQWNFTGMRPTIDAGIVVSSSRRQKNENRSYLAKEHVEILKLWVKEIGPLPEATTTVVLAPGHSERRQQAPTSEYSKDSIAALPSMGGEETITTSLEEDDTLILFGGHVQKRHVSTAGGGTTKEHWHDAHDRAGVESHGTASVAETNSDDNGEHDPPPPHSFSLCYQY
jgi:hypothetical protein